MQAILQILWFIHADRHDSYVLTMTNNISGTFCSWDSQKGKVPSAGAKRNTVDLLFHAQLSMDAKLTIFPAG